ncbi:MAG: glutathione S-transferase family protein, partial [Gammaproteobacteria bacterium]|nr:glutathione S-transferase family protein [Gammaproteobacteria bacterium]
MKIYGANLSPFVRKVLAVCSIKGLDYEHQVVTPGSPPEGYLKISPLGKIPALEDGDLAVSDSSVICEYLEEKYPAIPVLPADPADRARARWLEEFADTRLVEAVAPFFFENVFKGILGMGEPDTAKLEQLATEVIPGRLEYVESQVPAEGFLFGTIGTADAALCSPLINAGYGGFEADASLYPNTVAFL